MYTLGPVQWVSADTEAVGTEKVILEVKPGPPTARTTPRLMLAPTSHLGFVRVLQQPRPECTHTEPLPFSAQDVRQYCSEFELAVQPRAKLSIHGPAISYVKPQIHDEPHLASPHSKCGVALVDRILCLHVLCWPSDEFFARCRESGWLPEAALNDIREFGLHLVPVGAPGSATEHLEWRWSFSRAEVITVLYLDQIPRSVIKTMKACKKYANLPGKVLKSYHLKTAVFWLCQAEAGHPRWSSVSQGILQVLDYLEKAYQTKKLKCFYWKDINIMELMNRAERKASLKTVKHIRNHMKTLLIQSNWHLSVFLLQQPQPRLQKQEARIVLIRHMITYGVYMSATSCFCFAKAGRLDAKIKFAIVSSHPAEVCRMFREYTSGWYMKSFLLHALMIAPEEVVEQVRLTESESGIFEWDAAPLLALLTEDDLKRLLRDPAAVRAWLKNQPETERPAGLPADLRTPRDLSDLLLNTPLLVSVLKASVPNYRQDMDVFEEMAISHSEICQSFEDAKKKHQQDALDSFFNTSDRFHTKLGVDSELAQRRHQRFMHLFSEFCEDPAVRTEHNRLRNVMPDSWRLRPSVFRGTV
ncbi:Protein mab-21-like 3 [Amphibalanus amphitrite]|uniref:Protein mab-21-like 3 n=1 Tax=Amphibalanus amphitrite TaxID=1232801 RepID=A0A6A4V808_AMPAM|nr:Protein mab-21-like 3 [Amphibalanus amphitrite]